MPAYIGLEGAVSLIGALMSETVTIERAGSKVRDSTGSFVDGPKVAITVHYCAVMSPYGVTVGSSNETHNASETVVTDRVLAAPLGTDVRPGDFVVQADGTRWQVEGRPLVFPLTSLARVEAQLKEVIG
ncbi:hypothetical protein ACIQMR_35155 [Streptomyces sp. NPDC091376]|uniref:hypothetical protein n=1 Tax=Streptomyces sp. NPDC091376 TaxID=3365994 RepID=UPI003815DC9F